MSVRVLKNGETISRAELQTVADERFGDLVKAAVDIKTGVVVLGTEMHADAEVELIEKYGSARENVWGINLYPAESDDFIEFDSMINIKPTQGNRTRDVASAEVRKSILNIISVRIQ